MRRMQATGGLVALILTVAVPMRMALAAEAPKTPIEGRMDALEKSVEDTQKSIQSLLGIEIHGLVDTRYNYNFNTPNSKVNQIHVFDQDANSIELDQANLNIQRKKPEGIGFDLDLDFGKTAEVVGGATHWSNNPNNTESHNSIELRQAYVTYGIPNTPFSLMAGKFVTFHGAEVIKSYNNLNFNISNSILFGFAVPFTHTGFVGTYTLPNDLGSFAAGVVNGWDNPVDNNNQKSVTSMLTLTPAPVFTFALPVTYGAERDDSGSAEVRAGSKRLLVSPLFTVKPSDQLTFILEYDYGNESNVAVDPTTCDSQGRNCSIVSAAGNAYWQGAAAYAIFAPTSDWQFALRGEVFDDPSGLRTNFDQPGLHPGATFWEITPTAMYKITDGLIVRAEYRHDEADKNYFDKNNTQIRGQDLIESEIIYAF